MNILSRSTWTLLTIFTLGCGVYGCAPKSTPVSSIQGAGPIPSQTQNSGSPVPKTSETADAKDINTAVEKMLASENSVAASPIPKGSELRSAVLQGGVLTLDFSHQFNSLADAGDTTESDAQKKIMAAVRSFPGVEKLRVTVEGKPFNSQNTDWNTPFSVRLSDAHAPGDGTK